MTTEESTSVQTISNESINVKYITLEKGPKRQYNRKSKTDDKAKELMDKLLEEQELTRIKREQDEFDAQKKEVEEQESTRHIMEDIAQQKLKEQEKQEQQIEMDQILEKLIQGGGEVHPSNFSTYPQKLAFMIGCLFITK
ncbi:MAG: hypothetical protein EZS28_027918 [Streblomastix strix]|uniref:Uncharacterized protein n=1 Tax=Streblomastix strix TaxID=222440 RepID=A0A5J4V3E9_9EUKA|nr:MAG: hypothetical protein EZS28_027918 [Streblomastix strix]